ncbi:MAG: hypothetical protein ACO32Z_04935 [Gemmatimonadaceae bacterium]|jgi:hypothetical protein
MRPNHPLPDAALEALLRTLPREAPTTGFADRVMARVQLPAAVPVWRRMPWRALVGLAAVDLAVAAGLLAWFGDDLLHGVGDLLRNGAKLVVGVSAIDPGATLRAFTLEGIRSASAPLSMDASLVTALLIGAVGALFTIASLDRLARSASASSR